MTSPRRDPLGPAMLSAARRLVAGAVVLAAALCARPALAQAPPLEGCSYDRCALRVEPRVFEAPQIVRGTFGVPVASLGLLGADVERIVQGADSAVRQARAYRDSRRRTLAAGAASVVLASAAVAQCDEPGFILPGCSGSAGPLFVAAIAGTIYGSVEHARANRALSRALWWYNRALPR